MTVIGPLGSMKVFVTLSKLINFLFHGSAVLSRSIIRISPSIRGSRIVRVAKNCPSTLSCSGNSCTPHIAHEKKAVFQDHQYTRFKLGSHKTLPVEFSGKNPLHFMSVNLRYRQQAYWRTSPPLIFNGVAKRQNSYTFFCTISVMSIFSIKRIPALVSISKCLGKASPANFEGQRIRPKLVTPPTNNIVMNGPLSASFSEARFAR
jgi:hypothetical protein